MPALFTRQSRPPSFASPCSKKSSTWSRLETSQRVAVMAASLFASRAIAARVHVADMHARALTHERARDLEADAVRARGNHHPQPGDSEIHRDFPRLENERSYYGQANQKLHRGEWQ
jgi:hypothetical protein